MISDFELSSRRKHCISASVGTDGFRQSFHQISSKLIWNFLEDKFTLLIQQFVDCE